MGHSQSCKPLPPSADPSATYCQVSANDSAGYLLRTDGIVARSSSGGSVTEYMVPPNGVKYTSVNAGEGVAYLLRDDGKVDRTTGGGKIKRTYACESKYIAVSAGPSASYLVRADGAVDRISGWKNNTTQMNPPPGQRYTGASAGAIASYLVRSDGKVDRTVSDGKIQCTMSGDAAYVHASEQMSYTTSDGKTTTQWSNPATYLLRADGVIDRTCSDGKIERSITASVGTYVAACAGFTHSVLIRSDGAADIIKGGVHKNTRNPQPGTKFIGVSVSQWASYVLVDNGTVLRVTSNSSNPQVMLPGGQSAEGTDHLDDTFVASAPPADEAKPPATN